MGVCVEWREKRSLFKDLFSSFCQKIQGSFYGGNNRKDIDSFLKGNFDEPPELF
jgi:hypothetical protein